MERESTSVYSKGTPTQSFKCDSRGRRRDFPYIYILIYIYEWCEWKADISWFSFFFSLIENDADGKLIAKGLIN